MRKLLALTAAFAVCFGDQTLNFSIPNMSCLSCYDTIMASFKGVKTDQKYRDKFKRKDR